MNFLFRQLTVIGVVVAVVAPAWGQGPEPIALWAFPDGRTVASTSYLGVVAYHQGGVSSVVFSVEGSPVANVTEESINPETGEMEFILALDTTTYTEDSQLTIDAVVHAAPPGCPTANLSSRIVWVDNVPTHSTVYVDVLGSDATGTGASNAPYATIKKALSNVASGDEIRVRDGDYHLGADTDFGFTRFVHIRPDDGAGPVITSADIYRAGYLHIKGFTFDWTGVIPNLPDGGYEGTIIKAYSQPHAWFEDCTFFGPADRYNNYLSAFNFYNLANNLTVEGCRFHDVNRAIVASHGTIARNNEIGPIPSDAFDFFSEALITGNEIYEIAAPRLYIETTNAQPFNLVGAGSLTFYQKSDYLDTSYNTYAFADLSALVTNPTAVTAADMAQGFMADAGFSSKFEAADESGRLRVTSRISNYRQRLYVIGTANSVLGFPNEGQANEAVGSGQHADVFQTWGTSQSNVIIRNNRAYETQSQGLLPQTDLSNLAFVNNLIDVPVDHSWMINFESSYAYNNILLANNTLWGARATMHVQPASATDFVVYNNILGPRGVAGDQNGSGYTMDYNLYDYYAPAPGEGPAANSLWTNPGNVTPTPTPLFDQVTAVYNPETGYYDYSAPMGMFTMASNSPARNAGTDACGISYDINWDLRDASPDMGAFEYFPTDLEAVLLADPDFGAAPLLVQFDAGLSVGPDPITGYAWDFDDGLTSDEVAPVHEFVRRGSYDVVLRVFDTAGRTGEVMQTVQVKPYSGENLVLGLSCDGDILDHSPNRHPTSWQDGTAAYGEGQINEGLDLPGGPTGAFVEVPHAAALDGMAQFSFLCWFRKDDANVGGHLLHKHVVYRLAAEANTMFGYLFNSSGGRLDFTASAPSIQDTNGHHVAMIYDGATVRLYVDGVETATSWSFSGVLAVEPTRDISLAKDPWDDAFGGAVDEVFMYADALPPREISGRAFPESYDGYAVRYFTRSELADPNISDPDRDPDGDGIDNIDEYPADTDPMDVDSYLAFTDIRRQGNDIVLEWKGGVEARQIVSGSADLTGGGWYGLITNYPPTPVSNTVVLTGAPAITSEWFQVEAGR